MATRSQAREDAANAILKEIATRVEDGNYHAPNILQLAEAFAWIISPAQPHGGGAVPPKS